MFTGIVGVLNDRDQIFTIKKEFFSVLQKVEFINDKSDLVLHDIFVFPFLSRSTKPFEKKK